MQDSKYLIFEKDYCLRKAQIPTKSATKIIGELKKETAQTKYKSILHEYGLHSFHYGNRDVVKINLEAEHLVIVGDIVDFLCKKSSTLKPTYTFSGKAGEIAFASTINRLFAAFSLNKRVDVSGSSFIYGGDGGGDFFLGERVFDIKYRDDGPSHGMSLDADFLDRSEDETILVHTTNITGFKINGLDQYKASGQVFPVALSGWVTVEDFKKKAEKSSSKSFRLDGLNEIKSLLMSALEDQIMFEKLFV